MSRIQAVEVTVFIFFLLFFLPVRVVVVRFLVPTPAAQGWLPSSLVWTAPFAEMTATGTMTRVGVSVSLATLSRRVVMRTMFRDEVVRGREAHSHRRDKTSPKEALAVPFP
jgi:hypothetical protein